MVEKAIKVAEVVAVVSYEPSRNAHLVDLQVRWSGGKVQRSYRVHGAMWEEALSVAFRIVRDEIRRQIRGGMA